MLVKTIWKQSAKPRKRKISTNILIIVAITGCISLYIKIYSQSTLFLISQWWWAFIHRISALVSLIFTIPHTYKHRRWYKKFFKIKRKNKITIILSISFFITLLTTIILAIKRDSFPLEIFHSIIGIIAIISIVLHALKRYHLIK